MTERTGHLRNSSTAETAVLVIEGQIECRRRVGQRPDADPIHAGIGQRFDAVEIHTAGGFELDQGRGGITPADGLDNVREFEIVEEYDVGRARDRPVELLERINLDLNGRATAAWPCADTTAVANG